MRCSCLYFTGLAVCGDGLCIGQKWREGDEAGSKKRGCKGGRDRTSREGEREMDAGRREMGLPGVEEGGRR